MTVRFSWEVVRRGLLVLALGSFVALVGYLGVMYVVESQRPAQIITWKPSADSPYVCYVAVKGPQTVLAMDCLDTTLTVPKVAP